MQTHAIYFVLITVQNDDTSDLFKKSGNKFKIYLEFIIILSLKIQVLFQTN